MLRKDALFNCFSVARIPTAILFGQEQAKSLIERKLRPILGFRLVVADPDITRKLGVSVQFAGPTA